MLTLFAGRRGKPDRCSDLTWHEKGFELDINTTILIFMLVGLALQRTPIAYADAIRRAARQTGSMLRSDLAREGVRTRHQHDDSDFHARWPCAAAHADCLC